MAQTSAANYITVMSLLALMFVTPIAGAAPTPDAPAAAPGTPLYQATGEQYRAYDFPDTGESVPYRLFVPPGWRPGQALPVLVTLRAGFSIDNSHREGNDFIRVAGERGYIVISPLGYRGYLQPYYGSPYPIAREPEPSIPGDGWRDEDNQRAALDVMYVISRVIKEYGADARRVFIHGQNPSGSGALHLAATWPQVFAGVVVSSAPLVAGTFPWKVLADEHVPLLVLHGDADDRNPLAASRAMTEEARAAGVDAQFAIVPGGSHLTAYLTHAQGIFDFLDAHRLRAD
ncbi:MAG: prolyl oligopeptidase family serine peptidase [Gammaproteobacteria bacterium]|nr:prolyl oligopeptidase family serine peptidase [Gammaproteobacteria bacterium]